MIHKTKVLCARFSILGTDAGETTQDMEGFSSAQELTGPDILAANSGSDRDEVG